MKANCIPVTILTGGLGAGKTTLVNHILNTRKETRFAIIENEFGEIGIDQDLIDQSDEDVVVELSDGCICCTVRQDLVKALLAIYERRDDFDALLIETTGLAEPGPVAQVLLADASVREKYHLNAVVAVTDAEYLMPHLDDREIERKQAGFADILILNKIDRINEDEKLSALSRLSEINAHANIYPAVNAAVDTRLILDVDGFSLDRALAMDPGFMGQDKKNVPDPFAGLMDRMPTYGDDVSSVGIIIKGDMDEKKIDSWLTVLTSFQSDDIYRIKGILSIAGLKERLVIQGVHNTLTGDVSAPWGDAARESRLLFIGKNLKRDMLEAGFRKCLVSEPSPG